MAFENFPYSNFHELNLDWIVAKVKEAYSASNPPDYPVKSVNGMTGDVIIAIPANLVSSVNGETGDVVLYRNPLTQFPATDEQRWNLFRICDGDERGIEFDEDGAHRIEGTRRILIYDAENQPDFPVTSVNGQTGDVQITAGVNSVNGKTGNVVTPFVNPNSDILKLDSNSNTVLWGIARNVAGGEIALYITRGTGSPQAFIRYTPTGGQAINLPLLSSADVPSEAGVISVNGATGVVTLYGTDIMIDNASADTISQALSNESAARISADEEHSFDIDVINDSVFTKELTAQNTWRRGIYSASTGVYQNVSVWITTINYIDTKWDMVAVNNQGYVLYLQAWDENDAYVGVYNPITNAFDTPETFTIDWARKKINLSKLKTEYQTYKYRVSLRPDPSVSTTTEASQYIDFYYIQINDESATIETLLETQAEHSQQISDLQSASTTHTQQISALQYADSTHAQQIASLQSADSTHDQQISALQASQATQDQQISELYTRTGIYAIFIENVNSLPLRYPASGTDAKIKNTNVVVSMDLYVSGVQVDDWTITTYDGYLEITGTMNGTSSMTLYLA